MFRDRAVDALGRCGAVILRQLMTAGSLWHQPVPLDVYVAIVRNKRQRRVPLVYHICFVLQSVSSTACECPSFFAPSGIQGCEGDKACAHACVRSRNSVHCEANRTALQMRSVRNSGSRCRKQGRKVWCTCRAWQEMQGLHHGVSTAGRSLPSQRDFSGLPTCEPSEL